jgi:hypothetical protein
MPRGDRHWAAAQVGRPLEQRRTSGGKARNSTFATPGDGAGSDTRNLRGLMPNSPPNSLNLKHLGGATAGAAEDQRRKGTESAFAIIVAT